MAGLMWFGTREYMQWIPCPAINSDASKTDWNTGAKYLNGGSYVRRSNTSAKTLTLTWNMQHRDDIRPVTDYADGVYGTGPIFMLDPFAMDKNIFPQFWATPYLNTQDGPVRSTNAIPVAITTPTGTLGYPSNSAVYTIRSGASNVVPSVYLPVAPGYTIWIGVHGTKSGNQNVVLTPAINSTSDGTPVNATFLSAANTNRVTNSFSGDSYQGVTVSLTGTTGEMTLTGLIAQVLPTGVSPLRGKFISGQGHSGFSFESQPTVTYYSAALDRVGVSASLIETEAWNA